MDMHVSKNGDNTIVHLKNFTALEKSFGSGTDRSCVEILNKMRVIHACVIYDEFCCLNSIKNPRDLDSSAWATISCMRSIIDKMGRHLDRCEKKMGEYNAASSNGRTESSEEMNQRIVRTNIPETTKNGMFKVRMNNDDMLVLSLNKMDNTSPIDVTTDNMNQISTDSKYANMNTEDMMNISTEEANRLMRKYGIKSDSQTGGSDNMDPMKPTLVLYAAEWCGICRSYMPQWDKLVDRLKNQLPDLQIVSVVSSNRNPQTEYDKEVMDVCNKANIDGFPTIMFYNNGKSEKLNRGSDIVSHIKKNI